jgi:hypothetical protein
LGRQDAVLGCEDGNHRDSTSCCDVSWLKTGVNKAFRCEWFVSAFRLLCGLCPWVRLREFPESLSPWRFFRHRGRTGR